MNADTVSKLREIERHILEEPKRIHMGTYIERVDQQRPHHRAVEYPTCGTVGCIAGWAVALFEPSLVDALSWEDYSYEGREVLGLTQSQSTRLFANDGPFTGLIPQTVEYAQAVVRRIETFITSDGKR